MGAVTVSFTVEDKLTRERRAIIHDTVDAIKGAPFAFFTGCATGDNYAAECAVERWQDALHTLLVPQWRAFAGAPPQPCQHDREGMRRVSKLGAELGVKVRYHWCHAATGAEADGYMTRNDQLALNCSHLIAFPAGPDEVQRSGVWATVRRAAQRQRPVKIVPLDGSDAYIYSPSVGL